MSSQRGLWSEPIPMTACGFPNSAQAANQPVTLHQEVQSNVLLTASYEVRPPFEHNGSRAFTYRLAFSEDLVSTYSYRTMRDKSLRITQGGERFPATVAKRANPRGPNKNQKWNITITPRGNEDISIELHPTTDCTAADAICTADNRGLSSAMSWTVYGPPQISVADAEVHEAADATLDFVVSLNRATASTVSVDYTASSGTATIGEDFTATSGTLTFAAYETSKTVAVPVLDDSHDEGAETMTLTLSNPVGATLADATATGTIDNTDAMPSAWLSRFGREVAFQAVDAVTGRIANRGAGSSVQVGGQSLALSGGLTEEDAAALVQGLSEEDGFNTEALRNSALHLDGSGDGHGPQWSGWGRLSTSTFEGMTDDTEVDGDVVSGFLGADISGERWLAGAALGVSRGEGDYGVVDDDTMGGDVESKLTALYPYAGVDISDAVNAWAMAGFGSGDVTVKTQRQRSTTDISMRMGALGVRGELLSPAEHDGLTVAVKSDAVWVQVDSDAVESTSAESNNFVATESEARRFRALLEVGKQFGGFTPSLEVGYRQDGGDAETGSGLETNARLAYRGTGVSIDAKFGMVLSHEENGYEQWNASGSVLIDPGVPGRGVSLSVSSAWGRTSTDSLADDLLAEGSEGMRLDSELGYGMWVNEAVVTPYAGLSIGDEEVYRMGSRWQFTDAASASVEAVHRLAGAEHEADNRVMARVSLQF